MEDTGCRIEFAAAAPTDCAVCVLDSAGRVVRHPAAGVMGDKSPEPLKPGLAQSLVWNGKAWQREGPLNADPAEGSAGYVSLAVFKGKPVVAWAEAKGVSAPRQAFARARK